MKFGSSCNTDFERVSKSMAENKLKDPEPSMRSILQSEYKVMNLRPVQKEKHLASFAMKFDNKSQYERF